MTGEDWNYVESQRLTSHGPLHGRFSWRDTTGTVLAISNSALETAAAGRSEDPFVRYGETAERIVRGIWAGNATRLVRGRQNGRTLITKALVRAAREAAQDDAQDRSFENETRIING